MGDSYVYRILLARGSEILFRSMGKGTPSQVHARGFTLDEQNPNDQWKQKLNIHIDLQNWLCKPIQLLPLHI